MAYGFKSLKKAGGSGSAVQFSTTPMIVRIVCISTVGNSGTVYLGGSDVTASNGLAVGNNTLMTSMQFENEDLELDLSKLYLFSAGTDGVTVLYLSKD